MGIRKRKTSIVERSFSAGVAGKRVASGYYDIEQIDQEHRIAFLEELGAFGTIRAACDRSGVSYWAAWNLRRQDPEFAKMVTAALEDANDRLEHVALSRAILGFDRPVVYKGIVTIKADGSPVVIRDYDHRLMETLLKGRRYKDQAVQVTGQGGGPIVIKLLAGDETA